MNRNTESIDVLLSCYLFLSFLGFVVSGACQILFPQIFSPAGAADYVFGWQREIGMFNFAVGIFICWMIVKQTSQTSLTGIVMLLCIGLSLNHSIGFGRNPMEWHNYLVVLNLLWGIVGLILFTRKVWLIW